MEGLLRDLAPRALATLIRRYGAFDSAEDAVQEAVLVAAQRWSRDGVPQQPLGWLVRTASRRLIDAWRADRARADREHLVARTTSLTSAAQPIQGDDTIQLLFMCCHPALTPGSAIPLTLRAVGGLTTAEIARAFHVPEPTMAQRISRAKGTIRASGARFILPDRAEQSARLGSVLHVLYLLFSEGYVSSRGSELLRVELSDEAIRLARMLHAGLSDDGEVIGLLSLMLLTDARRAARTDGAGDLIPLPAQDRSRWDQDKISEGIALLQRATAAGTPGQYSLQAAIAAVHDQAPTAEGTDWPRIEQLYRQLEALTSNPFVTLNRAVASAMVSGPASGLAVLDEVAGQLGDSHRVAAVRAHLLEMAGDLDRAARQYSVAASLATSLPERRYLLTMAARLRGSATSARSR